MEGFASGYANIRTGWIAEKGLAEESAIFSEMFFSDRPKKYDKLEMGFHRTKETNVCELDEYRPKVRGQRSEKLRKIHRLAALPRALVPPEPRNVSKFQGEPSQISKIPS